MSEDSLRNLLARILDWQDAHVSFDAAVDGVPPALRGVRAEGVPYSAWQLLEHMRLAQEDILEFCQNPAYEERRWPEDYWPSNAVPERDEAWDESIANFRADREAMKALAVNTELDLFAQIPHGAGQTYLRELLLVADHNAYHVGQLVLLRRLLGIWGND